LHSDFQTQFAASTVFCKGLRSAVKLTEVWSVGRLIARRYLDGHEVPSFSDRVEDAKLRRPYALEQMDLFARWLSVRLSGLVWQLPCLSQGEKKGAMLMLF